MSFIRLSLGTDRIFNFNVQTLSGVDEVFELMTSSLCHAFDIQSIARQVWIYGAGPLGREMFSILSETGFEVLGFIDRHPEGAGGSVLGKPVLKPDPSLNAPIVVAVYNLEPALSLVKTWAQSEVYSYAQLLSGIPSELPFACLQSPPSHIDDHERLGLRHLESRLTGEFRQELVMQLAARYMLGLHRFGAGSHRPDQEYFVNSLEKIGAREAMLDLGAFDGDTATRFFHLGPDDVSVVAVEPDGDNFAALIDNFGDSDRVACVRAIVGKAVGTARIANTGTRGSAPVSEGGELVAQTSVDQLLETYRYVTRVKVDVEGGEQDVLLGAVNTIRDARVSWAIASYHKPEDLWLIPSYFPDDLYRVELASHASRPWDTSVSLVPKASS